ncbi:MAG: UMP kinase [Chlamydiia bacterium]|nr:UMP kinase [Chlamydiia bacterium]
MKQRILLKLSGEALMGEQNFGIDGQVCQKIAADLALLHQQGIQIALVIGGGNIFRGARLPLERTPADQMGMLATVMNGIALQRTLIAQGLPVRVMSAFACGSFVELYSWQNAIAALENQEIVLFVGGTGQPYFTTDTAAALRAVEIDADILLKATQVDGIYTEDPKRNPKAIKFDMLTYTQVLSKQLQVMDLTAITICRENQMPIRVFDLFAEQSLQRAVANEPIGTLVEGT